MPINKIFKNLVIKLIALSCIFFPSLSYADKNEISLFKENFSQNITRGGAKIGDVEVHDTFTDLDNESFPIGTLNT